MALTHPQYGFRNVLLTTAGVQLLSAAPLLMLLGMREIEVEAEVEVESPPSQKQGT